jgi:hypothetical protein
LKIGFTGCTGQNGVMADALLFPFHNPVNLVNPVERIQVFEVQCLADCPTAGDADYKISLK